MKLSRRSALAIIAAAAAGLTYTILPGSRQQRVRHILPSVTADSLSVSVSLVHPSAALVLSVDGVDHAGHQTDTEGRFWSFAVDGLSPATEYQLQLFESGAVIEDNWPLKTFPAWDTMPHSLCLLAYTCAGGGDGFGVGSRQFFKPHSFRRKLFEEGLAQNPDAAIAIGDHIYFDLKAQAFPSAGKGLIKVFSGLYMRMKYGAFDRDAPILGTSNETLLKRICDEQIADLYGTRFKSVPVFFVADDHDYFENDDANEDFVTFPPDAFSEQAQATIASLYYPPLPHPPIPDANRHFGIFRYGRLFEAPLFDCAGKLSVAGNDIGLIPRGAEEWIMQRTATSDALHFALVPSHPMGWTAGKWREWYPDVVAPAGFTGVVTNTVMDDIAADQLTTSAQKYLWPQEWWHQHQRLLGALYKRSGSRFMFSGDVHAQGAVAITASGNLKLADKPVISVLVGPVSSSDATWPSSARGIAAAEPGWIETETLVETKESNGFAILEIEKSEVRVVLHDCGGYDRSLGEDGQTQKTQEIHLGSSTVDSGYDPQHSAL
ncbi:MAG: phosphodiesterase [Halioglobus sp.]